MAKTLSEHFDHIEKQDAAKAELEPVVAVMGRPPVAASKKRRQIKVYVSAETEKRIRAGMGLKELGSQLDQAFAPAQPE